MQLNTAMTTTAVGSIVAVYHLSCSPIRAGRLELASTQPPAPRVIGISSLVQRLLIGLVLGAHRVAPMDPATVLSSHSEHRGPDQAAPPEATNAHKVHRVAGTALGESDLEAMDLSHQPPDRRTRPIGEAGLSGVAPDGLVRLSPSGVPMGFGRGALEGVVDSSTDHRRPDGRIGDEGSTGEERDEGRALQSRAMDGQQLDSSLWQLLESEPEPRQLWSDCILTLDMMDSYGDGWNGASWSWTQDSTNSVVSSGTLDDGSTGTASLCGTGECYTLSVDGGSYPNEISWTIVNGDTGEEEGSGGAEESAYVCIAVPSPQPTASPVPTVTSVPTTTIEPTPVPTATRYEVSSFAALSDSIRTNAQIDVVSDITFTAVITISGKTNVKISSSTGAVLSSDRSFSNDYGGIFRVDSNSDVTFTGLGFTSGSAEQHGGCLYVTGSSTVKTEDVDFWHCQSVSW